MQIYFPLLEISTVKYKMLSLLNFGQDEQESGINQVYSGSGDADVLQFTFTSSLTLNSTVLFCGKSNSGRPKTMIER